MSPEFAARLRLAARRSVPPSQYPLRALVFLVGASRFGGLLPVSVRERAVGLLVRAALVEGPVRLAYTGLAAEGLGDPCGVLVRE